VKARDRAMPLEHHRRPESDHRAADVVRHRLNLVTRHPGEPRGTHADLDRSDLVLAAGVDRAADSRRSEYVLDAVPTTHVRVARAWC
jgi:hypothetical protein